MIMFIRKRKYNSLVHKINELTNECKTLKEDKNECQKTIMRLTEEINQKTPECQVGPWCEDCRHRKAAPVDSFINYESNWLSNSYAGLKEPKYIYYCSKHTHEICSEWESKN